MGERRSRGNRSLTVCGGIAQEDRHCQLREREDLRGEASATVVAVATESGLLLTVMSDVIAHRLWRFGQVSMPEGVVGGGKFIPG